MHMRFLLVVCHDCDSLLAVVCHRRSFSGSIDGVQRAKDTPHPRISLIAIAVDPLIVLGATADGGGVSANKWAWQRWLGQADGWGQ